MLTNKTERIIEFINKLLINTTIERFSFDQFYTIVFSRKLPGKYKGWDLPLTISLHIENHWWFNSKEEWEDRIQQFPKSKSPDNDEPIQAYELAMIMWSEDTTVLSVSLNKEVMRINFASGRVLNISNEVEESEAWAIYETGTSLGNARWSIVSEGGKDIWTNIPVDTLEL